ncbi:MAG: M14 family zinc carboxypeptidase [Candidatus Thorarchaeota archaeon]
MILLPLIYTPTFAGAVTPLILPVQTPSINRTWNDVQLLYPDEYHNVSMLEEELENIQLNVPSLINVEEIGQSYHNFIINSVCITNENAPQQKAKTLVVAHHHGREKVTVEVALRFVLWLVNNYGVDDSITQFVDTQEIYVIPTLNPETLDWIYITGSPFLRKNMHPYDDDGDGLFDEDDFEDVDGDGRISLYEVYEKDGEGGLNWLYDYYEGIDSDGDGLVNEDVVGYVDINRNYDADWDLDHPSLTEPRSQQYHGTSPFSEPETRAFRDFALDHRFAMAYSLHTGINATLFARNAENNWAEEELYSLLWSDYQEILPPSFLTNPNYNPLSSKDAYMTTTPGGWETWMYASRECIVPISLEIYQNASALSEDLYFVREENATHVIKEYAGMFELFSPYESAINRLWLELLPSFEYLLEQTPRLSVQLNATSSDATAINVSLTATDLSPRINTINTVSIRLLNETVLESIPIIDADSVVTTDIELEFDDSLVTTNFQIEIGNEFVGFSRFSVNFIYGITYIPLVLGGVTVAVIAVVIVFIILRRR